MQLKFVQLYVSAGEKNEGGVHGGGLQVDSNAAEVSVGQLQVQAALEAAARKAAMAKLEVTKERIIGEVVTLAFYDMGDLVLDDPERPGEFLGHLQPEGHPQAAGADPEMHYRLVVGQAGQRRAEARGPQRIAMRTLCLLAAALMFFGCAPSQIQYVPRAMPPLDSDCWRRARRSPTRHRALPTTTPGRPGRRTKCLCCEGVCRPASGDGNRMA
ncbi:hypothetical protein [Bordetella genomosp. 13]|uniref:hypothetical protein n=1 Tax=Bordetella genomosp. 13 TaxID=463040 RepID=UPI0012F8B2A2|nr:hypothetical protein [Bordetella genomosp. 13]